MPVNKHPDRGISRSRISKFNIFSITLYRKRDGGDDLTLFQHCFKHIDEKLISRNRPLGCHDGCAQTQQCRRVICSGIVIGHGASNRAAISHLRVSNTTGQLCQCRNRSLNKFASGNVGVPCVSTNLQHIAFSGYPSKFCQSSKINQIGRGIEPLFHRW